LSVKDMNIAPGFEARLFQCSNAHGYFHMRELYNFCQEDLNNGDVMVLDTFGTIYCWIGRDSNATERKNVFKKVDEYISHLSDRNPESV
jgi:hypothetical protein